MELKFDDKGLIPAVVQDHYTGKILTVAYMNRESLEISMREGRTCFFSRSRGELWRKGETSGNYQEIVSVTADCDLDALVIEVIKHGPACHTGADSCFFNPVFSNDGLRRFSYGELFEMIKGRRETPKEGSYTSYLFEKGTDKILKKVGEECTEVIVAGAKRERDEAVFEIADLAYHVFVLMAELGIKPEDVTEELAKRHVMDKKVKQETMK